MLLQDKKDGAFSLRIQANQGQNMKNAVAARKEYKSKKRTKVR